MLFDPDSVEWDPRSADSNKIRIKDTRFAIPGSSVAAMWTLLIRFGLMMAEPFGGPPAVKSSSSGQTKYVTKLDYRNRGGLDMLIDFVLNKQAPALTVLTDRAQGKNRDGSKPTILKDLVKLFAPLPATTAVELAESPNSANIVVAMAADIFGSSVNTYPDSPYFILKQYLETTAQSNYGKSADNLTIEEYKTITSSPAYKEMEIAYYQNKRQGPGSFKQSADLFDAGKRIYDSLGGDANKILLDKGITAIGISDSVQGMRLNEKRLKLYEELVTDYIQSDLGDILGSADRDDMMKQINKSKERARKALVEFIESGQI
jgi:hypothetical protein